jgi:hypothetical protein
MAAQLWEETRQRWCYSWRQEGIQFAESDPAIKLVWAHSGSGWEREREREDILYSCVCVTYCQGESTKKQGRLCLILEGKWTSARWKRKGGWWRYNCVVSRATGPRSSRSAGGVAALWEQRRRYRSWRRRQLHGLRGLSTGLECQVFVLRSSFVCLGHLLDHNEFIDPQALVKVLCAVA